MSTRYTLIDWKNKMVWETDDYNSVNEGGSVACTSNADLVAEIIGIANSRRD